MPLLNDYMASTFSNGHSADKVSPGYYAPFVVSLYWCLHHLCNHKDCKKLSIEELWVRHKVQIIERVVDEVTDTCVEQMRKTVLSLGH